MRYAELKAARYTVYKKGGGDPVRGTTDGPLSLTTLDPEDFPLLVEGEPCKQWASGTNRRYAGRSFKEAGQDYWGKGIRTYQDLDKLVREGWPEGMEKIRQLAGELEALIPLPVGMRRRQVWADQGDDLDMAKVYGGQLDTAWRSMPRQRERAPRVISIDVDVGHNCHVNAEDLFWSGAAAVALTDALEGAGYRVELYSSAASDVNDRGVAFSRFVAKRAHEPLNPGLVAALVAHPATFRWYHLMSWLKHPSPLYSGFGRAVSIQQPLEVLVLAGEVEGTEVVMSESLSRVAAVKECTKALKRLAEEQDAGFGTMV